MDAKMPIYESFVSTSRYSEAQFHGIMIDCGAASYSTAGYSQYIALQRAAKGIILDSSTSGTIEMKFGPGDPLRSVGHIDLMTPIGNVRFHVLEAATPFLLSLSDLDRLNVYFDNLRNVLIGPKPKMTTPVIRKFGHPFIIWDYSFETYAMQSLNDNPCFFTETELRRLHRRFGHPSTARLSRLLERAGHDPDNEVLAKIRTMCHHCQIYGKSPGRFRFTIRDDVNFNHSIIVDVMYIESRTVLHIIDEATRYNAARWLSNLSTKTTWDTLRMMWIDSYLGPPDFIVTDAGKNFISKEFSQLATSLGTTVVSVPVEAHWSIGAVERYHAVLRRAYLIVRNEIEDINLDMALQMAVKAVNDTAGPDGLIPTLLVFGAYPRMTEYDPPAPTVQQRAKAIEKAMTEVRKAHAERQINTALNTRNGPSTTPVHSLPLNSDVLVWREGKTGYTGKWTGPYKLLSTDGETCTIGLPNGPTPFRTTVVKPYHNATTNDNNVDPGKTVQEASPKAGPPRRMLRPVVEIPPYRPESFVQTSFEIPDNPFAEARRKEINGLLERDVFEAANKKDIPPGTRIFTLRFVEEIKDRGTDKAFEKSRLVVQAYNDADKTTVLTESPTIQRCSQRLILCLAACKKDSKLYLRDVTQAYTQSTTVLNRDFYVRPPAELVAIFRSKILKVIRPLYGIPEAGNHWFRTYQQHHMDRLNMTTSTYDPCLLHCTEAHKGFGIVGMQTDDTLLLADPHFAKREQQEIEKASIKCKPREELTPEKPLKFNGGLISKCPQGITLSQKRTCTLIRTVQEGNADTTSSRGKVRKNVTPKEQYVAQRALGAYIASVCQPEAAFDLSFAAQSTNPTKDDIKALNKRLEWQYDNASRGLRFVPLDTKTLRLVTFTDASFANNKDLSSQIGFVIVLADAANNANIVHWSSIKCKRVTRSVLASEMYGTSHGFDTAAAIKSTITQLLHLTEPLPLIICTDSKSLYDCLVKLSTTQEKRLMIDLMCLRQSYERQEITEVRWIEGNSNPADAMTKSKPCRALEELINTNKLRIESEAWVERTPVTESIL
jgi:hypothetical protein